MGLRTFFCCTSRTRSFSEERPEAKVRRGGKKRTKRGRGGGRRNGEQDARMAYIEVATLRRGIEAELGGIMVQRGKVVRKKRDLELLLQKVFGNSKKGSCHKAIAGHYSRKLERLDSRARLLSKSIGQAAELQDLLSKGIINKCHSDVIVGSMVTELANNSPGPPSSEHRTISEVEADEAVSGTSSKAESSKSSEWQLKIGVVAGPRVAVKGPEEGETKGKGQEGLAIKISLEEAGGMEEEARKLLAAAYAANAKARMEERKEVEGKVEGKKEVEAEDLAAGSFV